MFNTVQIYYKKCVYIFFQKTSNAFCTLFTICSTVSSVISEKKNTFTGPGRMDEMPPPMSNNYQARENTIQV